MRRILRSIRRLSIRRPQGRLRSHPAACGACRGRGARLGGEARRLRVLRASRDRPLALGPRAPPFAVSKYGAAPHPPAHDALDASIEGPDPVRRRPAHGEVVEQAQAHGRHGRAPHFADGAEDGRAVLLELGRAGATVARSPPARPHAGPAAPDPVCAPRCRWPRSSTRTSSTSDRRSSSASAPSTGVTGSSSSSATRTGIRSRARERATPRPGVL